jgi:hypothetical protein
MRAGHVGLLQLFKDDPLTAASSRWRRAGERQRVGPSNMVFTTTLPFAAQSAIIMGPEPLAMFCAVDW